MNRFASDTSVSVERSKAEIERLLQRYGASQFLSGWEHGSAHLGFRIAERTIKFTLPLPDLEADEFQKTPGRGRQRSAADSERAWEQACRAVWERVLASDFKGDDLARATEAKDERKAMMQGGA